MFSTVLIANRGEIAVRVIKACRELGIATVAVYSDADADSLHVLEADEAIRIGPSPAVQSYLNIPALIEAARSSGAEAIHPGYGFLSENPEFAEACLGAGLVWVGPPPAAMRAMASKIAARRLAAGLGVPILTGYDGDDQRDERFAVEAERIGYPVLVKASAGGGGRGMRVVDRPDDLPEALAGARRESRAAFGDDALLLERYVRRPRHIEIQIFGDTHGTVVSLGERECSIQRRHQKVIEESPSSALTPALRVQMSDAAVRLARAIGYTGAGTVEYILDEFAKPTGPGSSFAFLEMNTRLQVEHGVTELVTGIDLVQLQLRVADGEPLRIETAPDPRGHAVQCRVYAEDSARQFLPAGGRLERFRPPAGPGIRNDVGVYEGDTVSTHYDALLAKLLVWGETRDAAIVRCVDALARYQVAGMPTNLPLLRATVAHPEFAAGHTYTSFLDEHILPTLAGDALPPEMLIAAVAHDLLAANGDAADPWRTGPWRPAGAEIRRAYLHQGSEHEARATRRWDGSWDIAVDGGVARHVVLSLPSAERVVIREDARSLSISVKPTTDGLTVAWRGREAMIRPVPPPSVSATAHASAAAGGARALTAPLAGVVVKVEVAEGDVVEALQPLVIIEAMKMEHTVEAVSAGRVMRLHRAVGDRVQAGDVLVELAPT